MTRRPSVVNRHAIEDAEPLSGRGRPFIKIQLLAFAAPDAIEDLEDEHDAS